MKEEIIQDLLILQTVVLCFCLVVLGMKEEKHKEELASVHAEFEAIRTEMDKMKDELRHNNIIVLKVLEGEW